MQPIRIKSGLMGGREWGSRIISAGSSDERYRIVSK